MSLVSAKDLPNRDETKNLLNWRDRNKHISSSSSPFAQVLCVHVYLILIPLFVVVFVVISWTPKNKNSKRTLVMWYGLNWFFTKKLIHSFNRLFHLQCCSKSECENLLYIHTRSSNRKTYIWLLFLYCYEQ